MSRRRPRDSRPHISEKADPNIQVVVAQQGVATPAQMPRNMRAYIQEGYRSNGTVFRVVGHIARSCAGIKWKHYTDETKKREIPNSELLQLWNNPSPKVSGTAFREAMIAYYCLTGNSYVLGINASQNQAGKFDELYNLRPDHTKIKVDNNGPLYYEFGNFSPPRRYGDPFVMHNKLFAGNDDVYGMSPIEVAAMDVDIQKAGKKWNLGLMSNMARPGGAWVTDALLGDTEYKQLKEEIRKKFAGPRNAGETAILHGGVKWQSMSMSPYELDWLESSTKGDRDIAGIFFNFPLFLLGLADSTYTNQEEARYALYTEIDFPILDTFQDSTNMWLTPRYGGFLGYDQEDVEAIQARLQEAKGQASDRATAEFAASTATFLEAREIQGRPKLNVKDFVIINQVPVHVEDLDDYIAAMSGKTINPPPPPPQLLSPAGQTTVTEVPNTDNQDNTDTTPPPQKLLPPDLQLKVLDLQTEAEKAAYLKTVESRRTKWEKVIKGRLQDYFRDEHKTIAAALSRGSTENAPDNVAHAFMVLEQQGTLKNLIVGIYQDVGEDFGESVLKDLKFGDASYEQKLLNLHLNLHAPDVLVHLLQIAGEKVRQIYGTTLAFLQEHLTAGVQAGETLDQVAQRVDDLYTESIIPERSQTISATEVHSANEYGSSQAAQMSGLTLKKVWLSTFDSKVRADHADAHGQEVGTDEPFIVGGEQLMYPGDPAGSPGNIINCRCTVYYISVQSQDDEIGKALTKYARTFPQLIVTREHYRELLRIKR